MLRAYQIVGGETTISLGGGSVTVNPDGTVSIVGDTDITGSLTADLTGNADTATALATGRDINGVEFDGTANITVTAAAGTLTGTTLKSTVVSSSLTSLGTIGSLVATTADINGGTIDGTAIGATTPAAGAFTTGAFSGAVTIGGDIVMSRTSINTLSLADGDNLTLIGGHMDVQGGGNVTVAATAKFYPDGGGNTFIVESSADVLDLVVGAATTLRVTPTGVAVTGNSGFGVAVSSSTFGAFGAATTAKASLRAPHGTAPTSPVNGDIWTTASGLFARINGSTVGPYIA